MKIRFKIDPCKYDGARGTFVLDINERDVSMKRLSDLFTRAGDKLSYVGQFDVPTPAIIDGYGISQTLRDFGWSLIIVDGSGYDETQINQFVEGIRNYLKEE